MVNASGFVNLLSSTYPGPGFTGQYQMAGDLTLTPNPFNDSSATAAGNTRRRLVEADTRSVAAPVQGAVVVNEQRIIGTTSANASTSVAYVDPDGSVVVSGEVPEALRAP